MKKQVLALLLTLITFSVFPNIGGNENYTITSTSDFSKMILKQRDIVMTRYILVPEINKKAKDIMTTQDEDALLAKFAYLLKDRNEDLMSDYILKCNETVNINNLLKGLYYFSKKQYTSALYYLEKFNGKKYSFLRLLLIADCYYELLPDKSNFKTILPYYQTAIDSTNDDLEKLLITNRIKYIKYN